VEPARRPRARGRHRWLGALLTAGLAIAIAVPAAAETAAPGDDPTAEEIEACVRANLPSRSSIQTVAFRVHGRGDLTTESRVKIHWQMDEEQRSNVLLRFEQPPDMRDSALLLLEKPGRNDMFMYLPELKRVRRVTGPALSGGMFGTDFTYSQFERLQGVARDVSVEREPDGEVDGRTTWVLSHVPADDPEFVRVVSHVDPERCVPLRTEFFESGPRLRKVLVAEEPGLRQADGLWVPHHLVMKDVVQGTSTEFIVEEIELGAKIHRKMFTQSHLAKGN